jgi:hypothetical protein
MSIYINNSGTLKELTSLSVNEGGGVLNTIDTGYANNSGTLKTIFNSSDIPKTLTLYRYYSSGSQPVTDSFTQSLSSDNTMTFFSTQTYVSYIANYQAASTIAYIYFTLPAGSYKFSLYAYVHNDGSGETLNYTGLYRTSLQNDNFLCNLSHYTTTSSYSSKTSYTYYLGEISSSDYKKHIYIKNLKFTFYDM